MDNNSILEKRWKFTDDKLKEYLRTYRRINKRTQDKIQDIFNSVNFKFIDLYKPISQAQRRKLLRIIEEWEKQGLLNGYFKYNVDNLIRKRTITNQDMFNILIWGAYIEERNELDEYEQILFTEVGKDLYNQGIKEINPKANKKWSLIWEFIWAMLCLPNVKGNSWVEYIQALALTNAQEIQRQSIIQLQQNKELNIEDDVYTNIIRKQQNRYISIDEDKFSGALDNQVVEIANKSLLKAGEDVGDKDLKIRFIAEMDERTTKMCRSMDNMLFNVNDWNTFYRYSESDKAIVLYKIKGLELGVNLPPINNHFHYCRSTMTYQIDMKREELNKNLQTYNEKLAISKWLSSDFYTINRKMYSNQKLNKDEKKLVKDLYRALNKEPYYVSKPDEYITRVLEVDEDTIQSIIDSHPLNKVYKSKAFESYSLKGDYNKDANVYFYVMGSKKARNMLEYNPMEREAEVLYQYGTKFITKAYYTKNGKHHFLLEEL